jgi:uncharacterized protein YkwD
MFDSRLEEPHTRPDCAYPTTTVAFLAILFLGLIVLYQWIPSCFFAARMKTFNLLVKGSFFSRLGFSILPLLAGAFFLPGCGSQSAVESQYVSGYGSGTPEAKVHSAVNGYRASKGQKSLTRDSGLDALALKHSVYLSNHQGEFSLYGANVSHYGFEGRAVYARRVLGMEGVSENVACTDNPGSDVGQTLVGLWAKSKDHEYSMRQPWTHTGIGYFKAPNGRVFCTQLFAVKGNAMRTSREMFDMR